MVSCFRIYHSEGLFLKCPRDNSGGHSKEPQRIACPVGRDRFFWYMTLLLCYVCNLEPQLTRRQRITLLTWPNGTKGGGPPSAPILLLLCLARLWKFHEEIIIKKNVCRFKLYVIKIVFYGESSWHSKIIPHPLYFPFLHHVINFSSKDGDVRVIKQHKTIFNLDRTKQLYFCSWWGIKTEKHKQEKYKIYA